MTTDLQQIKPCPFCGSEAGLSKQNTPAYEDQGFFHDRPHQYTVYCTNRECRAQVDCGWLVANQNSALPVVTAWNRRIESALTPAEGEDAAAKAFTERYRSQLQGTPTERTTQRGGEPAAPTASTKPAPRTTTCATGRWSIGHE